MAPDRSEAPATGLGADYAGAALGAMSEGVVVQLASGEIVTCNPAAERLLGVTRDQMAGRTFLDPPVWNLTHEDGSPCPGEAHPGTATLATGQPLRGVVMGVCRPDGTFGWISVNTEPIPGAGEQVAGVVITFVDITSRRLGDEAARRGAEAIRRSEDDFRYVFEKSVVGMTITFPRGQSHVNEALARMLGYESPSELEGLGQHGATHPDDLEESRRLFAELVSGQRDSVTFVQRYLHRDGHVVWAENSASIRRDSAGHPRYVITISIDITEHRRLEESLREAAATSKARARELESLMDAVPASVFIGHGPSCHRMTGNRAAEELLRLGPGANPALNVPVGERPTSFRFFRDGRELLPEELPMERAAATGEPQRDVELTLHLGPDSQRQLLGNAVPLRNDQGAIRGAVGAFIDITDRNRAEEALRASEEAFRLAFENANIGMCLVDPGGRLVRVNREMSAIFGYRKEELEGMSVNDIAHPDFRDVSPTFIRRAEAGEIDRTEFEKAYIHKDGHLVWGRVSSSLVRDARGEPLHFISHVLDVTERKRTDEALRRSEERLRQVLEKVEDVVWTVDAETWEYTFLSPAAEKVFGYAPDEMIGRPGIFGLTAASAEKLGAALGRPGRVPGQPSETADFEFVRKDGSVVAVESRASLVLDDTGRRQVVGVTRDITGRIRAEEEIRRLNAELEQRVQRRTAALTEATRELEYFSYSVSHDLRAPLRAVNGFATLLDRHLAVSLDDEGRRLLRSIGDNGLLMGSLVDGLLDFTRTRSRELKRVPLDMKQLAEEVIADLVLTPGREHIRTVVADLPPVHADRDLCATVLKHLLSNAIRFSTSSPAPVVEVGFEPGANGSVYFVRDNGIGFDPRYADKLFQVFQRMDGPPEPGRTGIGLALVRRIVERHEGRVWAEGEVGKGATFYFTLAPNRFGE